MTDDAGDQSLSEVSTAELELLESVAAILELGMERRGGTANTFRRAPPQLAMELATETHPRVERAAKSIFRDVAARTSDVVLAVYIRDVVCHQPWAE